MLGAALLANSVDASRKAGSEMLDHRRPDESRMYRIDAYVVGGVDERVVLSY
jgi:hypothetical protein